MTIPKRCCRLSRCPTLFGSAQRRRLDFDAMTFRRDGVMGEVEPGHFVLTGEEDGQ